MTFGRLHDFFPDAYIMDQPLDSLSRGQPQTLAKAGAGHVPRKKLLCSLAILLTIV